MERGNGDKIVEGGDRGGFEGAAHLVNNLILCNLKGFDKTLDMWIVSIEGKAVSEDGENQSMEQAMPVHEVQALNGVPQEVKGAGSGVGSIGHDGDMMGPIKFVMDEDA